MQTAGQIIGYIAMAVSFAIFFSTRRSRILLTKTLADSLWALNMLLTGSYTGALISSVNIARGAVFYQRGKKKWAESYLWLILFLAATLVSPIITWAGPISILPALGSGAAVIGYFNKNPRITRLIALFVQIAWISYDVLVFNLPKLIADGLVFVSAIIGMVRQHLVDKEQKTNEI